MKSVACSTLWPDWRRILPSLYLPYKSNDKRIEKTTMKHERVAFPLILVILLPTHALGQGGGCCNHCPAGTQFSCSSGVICRRRERQLWSNTTSHVSQDDVSRARFLQWCNPCQVSHRNIIIRPFLGELFELSPPVFTGWTVPTTGFPC